MHFPRRALTCRGKNVTYVREDVKLDVVFKEFMSSATHMVLVRREPDMPGGPDGDVTGLITLEDVMEELIGVKLIFTKSSLLASAWTSAHSGYAHTVRHLLLQKLAMYEHSPTLPRTARQADQPCKHFHRVGDDVCSNSLQQPSPHVR